MKQQENLVDDDINTVSNYEYAMQLFSGVVLVPIFSLNSPEFV